MLGDAPPQDTPHDPAYVPLGYAKAERDVFLGLEPSAAYTDNFPDLFGGELSHGMSRAVRPAVLCDHVCDVVGLSAQEQMLGVTAGASIACVQDRKPPGDDPVCVFPCDAVGSLVLMLHRKGAVSGLFENGTEPRPACHWTSGLIDFGPEIRPSLGDMASVNIVSAMPHDACLLKLVGKVGASVFGTCVDRHYCTVQGDA